MLRATTLLHFFQAPDWKAKELRRAYWAALSFTDRNIGQVLDALDSSPFANNTTICLWGVRQQRHPYTTLASDAIVQKNLGAVRN